MDDAQIFSRIDELVAEEDRLREPRRQQSEHEAADRERLRELEIALDRCWDLLRQRRARREFGDDPEFAAVRDPETVERYQQ